MSELKIKYFSNTKYPLFRKEVCGIKYQIIKGKIFFQRTVYRNEVVRFCKIVKSPYCNTTAEKRLIGVFNLKGELMATVRNSELAYKLFPQIPDSTINRQLNKNTPGRNRSELSFKYLSNGK